ncbi:MAG: phenylalanine--tRNA ligase beta subunit-related protein [Thermovirgaceae bacterium]|nr:phenylalanine--tRNA ligase beta subunit-related protein [Thermovirgaceae bacterium]
MRKFLIEEKVFELFPQTRVCGLVIENMDNGIPWDGTVILGQACQEVAIRLGETPFAESPFFAPWRAAFKLFGAPKGYRSSVEALAKRAVKGSCPSSINPLVDLYNVTSLKFLFPCGAEDLDAVVGDVRLRPAGGGEPFLPLGAEEDDPPREEEMVYIDDAGAICRCWNWREADRTKLTRGTKRALLCMESLAPERDEEMRKALAFIDETIRKSLGAATTPFWLDSECRHVDLPGERSH